MANISTNQVKQLYVLAASDTLDVKSVQTAKGTEAFIEVKDSNSKVKDKTDFIPVDNIMYTTIKAATDDTLHRKAFEIKLNSNINGGAPIAGQDYIITLTYRGFYGEEATMHKTAEVHAITGMTAAQFYAAMAKSFLLNSVATSGQAFFELYKANGTQIKTLSDAAAVNDSFFVVEPVPYWSLGRFPETLEKMEITTSTILVDTDMVSEWLDSYDAVDAVEEDLVDALPNSRKMADLEYFCKGERGISAPLHVAYRDRIDPKLEIDPTNASGYDLLTIHYAFIGHNAANQRSEKDIVFAIPNDGTSTLEACVEALTAIGDTTSDDSDEDSNNG